MSEPTDPDAGAIFRASAEQLAAFTITWQTLIALLARLLRFVRCGGGR